MTRSLSVLTVLLMAVASCRKADKNACPAERSFISGIQSQNVAVTAPGDLGTYIYEGPNRLTAMLPAGTMHSAGWRYTYPDGNHVEVSYANRYYYLNYYLTTSGGRVTELRTDSPEDTVYLEYTYDAAGKLSALQWYPRKYYFEDSISLQWEDGNLKRVLWFDVLGDNFRREDLDYYPGVSGRQQMVWSAPVLGHVEPGLLSGQTFYEPMMSRDLFMSYTSHFLDNGKDSIESTMYLRNPVLDGLGRLEYCSIGDGSYSVDRKISYGCY